MTPPSFGPLCLVPTGTSARVQRCVGPRRKASGQDLPPAPAATVEKKNQEEFQARMADPLCVSHFVLSRAMPRYTVLNQLKRERDRDRDPDGQERE